MAAIYFDSAQVGDLIPPLTKPAMNRVQMSKFAAACKDFNALHLDDEAAKASGFGSTFAQGNLVLGHIEEALCRYASNAHFVSLNGTFHRLVWPGDLLTAKALISKRHQQGEENRLEFEVWVENQNHEIVVKGKAVCLVFANDSDERKNRKAMPSPSTETRAQFQQDMRNKMARIQVPSDKDLQERAKTKRQKQNA